MNLSSGPEVTDWPSVPMTDRPGISGISTQRTRKAGDVQMRFISFGRDYVADHWCQSGHIIFVVDGKITVEHEDGPQYDVGAGMSYHVGNIPHRVSSPRGASIFVIDWPEAN